jgi:hypothetical protein
MKVSSTTTAGIGSIVLGVVSIVVHSLTGAWVQGGSMDVSSLALAGAAIANGIGHLFARDNTTSDEAAGVTPQQVALQQAIHTAASAAPVTKTDPTTGVTTITPAAPTALPSVLTKA